MFDVNTNPVIDKIKKMLAVQRSTNHEGEANAAAALIQKLLQDHGLEMAQVEAASGTKAKDDRNRIKTDRRAMFKWQRDLMEALAKNHFCMYFISEIDAHDGRKSRKSKQHVLLGRSVYVAATLSLYDYLVIAIKRAADEQGYKHEAATEKMHHMFIEGAIERLVDRLRDIRDEREREEARKREEARTRARHPSAAPTSGTDIVLSEVYQTENDLNEDFQRGWEPGTTARKRAESEAKRAAQDALYEKLKNEGVPDDVAYYMAYAGYKREQAESIVAANKESEKRWAAEEAKRAKRSSRSRSSGSSRGPSQADMREWERRNSPAYKSGSKTADSISLNTQVGSDRKRRLS